MFNDQKGPEFRWRITQFLLFTANQPYLVFVPPCTAWSFILKHIPIPKILKYAEIIFMTVEHCSIFHYGSKINTLNFLWTFRLKQIFYREWFWTMPILCKNELVGDWPLLRWLVTHKHNGLDPEQAMQKPRYVSACWWHQNHAKSLSVTSQIKLNMCCFLHNKNTDLSMDLSNYLSGFGKITALGGKKWCCKSKMFHVLVLVRILLPFFIVNHWESD